MNENHILTESNCVLLIKGFISTFASKELLLEILKLNPEKSDNLNFIEFASVRIFQNMENNVQLVLEPGRIKIENSNGLKLTKDIFDSYLLPLIEYIDKKQNLKVDEYGFNAKIQISDKKITENPNLLLGEAFQKEGFKFLRYGVRINVEEDSSLYDFNIIVPSSSESYVNITANIHYKVPLENTKTLYQKYLDSLDGVSVKLTKLLG